MAYFAPQSWYEPDVEPETPADYGWVHEDDIPNTDEVQDYLIGMLNALYHDGNVSRLEGCLEELCHLFDVEYKGGDCLLEKKKPRDLMQWYLGYQRATIDQMNHNGRCVQDYMNEVNHG